MNQIEPAAPPSPERSEPRVLDDEPCTDLPRYLAAHGMQALDVARRVEPEALVDVVERSGLRGRGGAGFPTGTKWRTVVANRAHDLPTTVVVNGAEGEPGSFKDRAILRANPYRVIEGALIAARAVSADLVVIAVKETSTVETDRLRRAVDELRAAGWLDGIDVTVATGPSSYLFGEETALLEVLDGNPPFPRLAPPYRQGADVVSLARDDSGGTRTGGVVMATDDELTPAPPTLVNNVETLANVPGIVLHGADWFRSVGTASSPGTMVCTVSGDTVVDAVGEVPMGTPLREAIDLIGGGVREGRRVSFVLPGVSAAAIPGEAIDVPLTHQAFAHLGTGLGAGAYLVFDDRSDPIAVAAGASRFLAVESCGQCHPCKFDGVAIADLLRRASRSVDVVREQDVDRLSRLLVTVDVGARCSLAGQQREVVGSLIELFVEELQAHLDGELRVEPRLVAPILDIVDGVAVLDERHAEKQPDWTFGATDSGSTPAELLIRRG